MYSLNNILREYALIAIGLLILFVIGAVVHLFATAYEDGFTVSDFFGLLICVLPIVVGLITGK